MRHTFPVRMIARIACASALLTLCWSAIVLACPGCKEALFEPGQLQQKLATARAYALSIGVMLAVPACLIGGITTLIIRSIHRARRAAGAATPHSPTP